jgi:phosphatidylserine decarboxylase
MGELTRQVGHERYRGLFGYQAGYLPADFAALLAWQRQLKEAVDRRKRDEPGVPASASVTALARLIASDGIVRMYVDQMIGEVPEKDRSVEDIPDLLDHLDHVVRLAPEWEADPDKRVFFPMSALFGQMMITDAGEAVFRHRGFNDAIRWILKDWCGFLDSANSLVVLNEGPQGWLSPPAAAYNRLDEFVIPDRAAPHWGWESFNAFFHRQIRAEVRPIAAPHDPKVITSPNDGTVYKIACSVLEEARFWLKGQPYSLGNMLGGSAYVDRFIGGDVFQSFLSGADFHRWHAPIGGTVREAVVVDGLMFSNAESAGPDPKGILSQGYQTSVNTRGLIFIESEDPVIGLVCCIPVGITEISSITIGVKRGDRVTKGDELGYFSYGGSSMALVFQPGAIKRFTVNPPSHESPDKDVPIQVNSQIAVAN